MHRLLIFILSFSIINSALGQSAEQLAKQLNFCIENHSTESTLPCKFFKQSGAIEQQIGSKTIRFYAGELSSIEVVSTEAGYAVNTHCKENAGCINVIKQDATSSSMQSNSYFFNDAGIANLFAKNLQTLSQIYNKENPATVSYYKTPTGLLPMYNLSNEESKKEETESNTASGKPIKQDFLKVDEDEDSEAPGVKTKQKIEKHDDIDEAEEKGKKTSPDAKPKPTAPPPSQATDDAEDSGVDCKKITQLLAAAQSSFKSIEGKETNPSKKINESTLKMKGAKKNYLSWFQQKRVFIAEYKYNNYFDVLSDAFDNLQATLEDCLGADWDSEDMSGNEEYSNLEGDIKDVEYSHSSDSAMPKIRLLLLPDGKRYVLFMRVQ